MSEVMTVQETFTRLNKQFGNINIKQLSELSPVKDDIVSTGIMGLDIALGVGGIKKGSIVEIYGPESGGKTTAKATRYLRRKCLTTCGGFHRQALRN